MKWLILLLALAAVVFVLGMRWGRAGAGGSLAFQPVSELPEDVRRRIAADLRAGLRTRARRTYRQATGASTAAADAALSTFERGGMP